MKTLVIIPTYNEKENIQKIVPAVLRENPQVEVLVVDDNSPDQTGAEVRKLQETYQNQVHLLSRDGKEGLGKAYLAGFKWALSRDYDVIVEMDADFSHRPIDLTIMLQKITTSDFVVGSRYVHGGSTVNWGILRKLISRGGGLYSRIILGYPLQDWTGGFNAWKKAVLEKIGLDSITSNGYSFQIELKYKALRNGFRGVESPITFEDRRVGQSKMSLKIVLEAFYKVWQIRFG
ncbi:MAG: polyprenol monophosphomannose synthase [Bdellovibrionales bacterium]|nr:polyprenol monophosphomannose synthase [Bdellovibrionales bacterium]